MYTIRHLLHWFKFKQIKLNVTKMFKINRGERTSINPKMKINQKKRNNKTSTLIIIIILGLLVLLCILLVNKNEDRKRVCDHKILSEQGTKIEDEAVYYDDNEKLPGSANDLELGPTQTLKGLNDKSTNPRAVAKKHRHRIKKRGKAPADVVFNSVYDLYNDSKLFVVDGFQYYDMPVQNKYTKSNLESIWLLSSSSVSGGRNYVTDLGNGTNGSSGVRSGIVEHPGMIGIRGLQQQFRTRWTERLLREVTVLIKYRVHLEQEGAAYLTVYGADRFVKNTVYEDLPVQWATAAHCTKIVFLGPADQVVLDARTFDNRAYVMIDELKIDVGTGAFDSLQDSECE